MCPHGPCVCTLAPSCTSREGVLLLARSAFPSERPSTPLGRPFAVTVRRTPEGPSEGNLKQYGPASAKARGGSLPRPPDGLSIGSSRISHPSRRAAEPRPTAPISGHGKRRVHTSLQTLGMPVDRGLYENNGGGKNGPEGASVANPSTYSFHGPSVCCLLCRQLGPLQLSDRWPSK